MTKVINKPYTKADLRKLNELSNDKARALGKWVNKHGEYRSANLTTGSNGVLVPQGVLNAAMDLSNRKFQLQPYVTTINVTNGIGKMPLLNPNETAKPKEELAEDPDLDGNDLGSINYNVKTYLGRLNISNEFISDSNANIMPLLTHQLGTVISNTKNAEIAKAMETIPAKSISTMDDLITAISDLDVRYQSNIFMDQHSWAKVREFKDANGRYLLNESDNTILGIPVVVVPAYTGLQGVYVGDLKTAVIVFSRLQTTLQYNRPGIYGSSLVAALRFDVKTNPEAKALIHLKFNEPTK